MGTKSNVLLTLGNIQEISKYHSPIHRVRVTGSNNKVTYQLVSPLSVELSTGDIVHIPSGFTWDLSSVPRILWWLLPTDGDFELGVLLHDLLYTTDKRIFTRAQADLEMYLWSAATSGTVEPFSMRNLDNLTRYTGVRLFGWIVWNKIKTFKDLWNYILGKHDKTKNHEN